MGGIALARPELKVDAFADAVAPHYPALVRRLAVVVGDPDAGLDLAQETYLRAFRAWDRFDGADVRAWLHTIGLRLAFNERSRRRRWSELLRARRREPVGWVAPRDLDLHAALSGLRREHRAALLMNVVDGYTHEQIAGMLDVAPGTVASWISRAKQHLRVALEDTTDG
jgi:RNA polymerase sigma-70 factor (ECF subfamily)